MTQLTPEQKAQNLWNKRVASFNKEFAALQKKHRIAVKPVLRFTADGVTPAIEPANFEAPKKKAKGKKR